MEFSQFGEDIVVDKIDPGTSGYAGAEVSDDTDHRASGLASGANQDRRLAGLHSGNYALARDGCHLGIVDLIDDLPREILLAAIRHVSRNQQAMPPARGKSDQPGGNFEGCHLSRQIRRRKARPFSTHSRIVR